MEKLFPVTISKDTVFNKLYSAITKDTDIFCSVIYSCILGEYLIAQKYNRLIEGSYVLLTIAKITESTAIEDKTVRRKIKILIEKGYIATKKIKNNIMYTILNLEGMKEQNGKLMNSSTSSKKSLESNCSDSPMIDTLFESGQETIGYSELLEYAIDTFYSEYEKNSENKKYPANRKRDIELLNEFLSVLNRNKVKNFKNILKDYKRFFRDIYRLFFYHAEMPNLKVLLLFATGENKTRDYNQSLFDDYVYQIKRLAEDEEEDNTVPF